MKTSFTSGMIGATACTAKKLLCIFLATFAVLKGYATTYYSNTAGGVSVNTLSTWTVNNNNTGANPTNFTTAGDIFIIQSAVTMGSGWTVSGAGSEVRLNSGSLAITSLVSVINFTVNAGTINFVNNDIQINGGTWTYNAGTLSMGTRSLLFTGTSVFAAGSGSYGRVQVSGGTTTCSTNFTITAAFTNNGTFTQSAGTATFNGTTSLSGSSTTTTFKNLTISSGTLTVGNFNFNVNGTWTNNATYTVSGSSTQTVTFGTGGDIAGTSITGFRNLTINTTAASDIVSLTRSGCSVTNSSGGGTLTLTQGVFRIGTGNVFFLNNSGASITNTANGNLATTGTNGSDGGKIIFSNTSGGSMNINGTGLLTFYDLIQGGYTTGTANTSINQNNNNVLINDTLRTCDNNASWNTNSPKYSSNATFYIDNNTQTYNPGAGGKLQWLVMSSGTIGTTPGYPNNVVMTNVGTGSGGYNNGNGWVPSAATMAINGTFTLGNNVSNAQVDFSNVTFYCGGFVLNTNSRFTAPQGYMTVKGNWTDNQAVVGTGKGFFVNTKSTVTFAGAGTCATPNTITVPSTTTAFYNLVDSNSAYISLSSAVSVSNTLNLKSGIIATTSTNLLSITNTATTAVSGGGSSSFINGPLKWGLLSSGTNTYTYPLGAATCPSTYSYLPFALTSANMVAGNAATVQAFSANSGGTPDGSTVTSLSTTEYWSLTSTGSLASSTAAAGRPAGVGSFNMLAKSTTVNGTYSGIGGLAGTVAGGVPAVVNGAISGTPSPWYIVMAYGPLSINVVSTTYPDCNGSGGAITVAGSGGTPSYTYNVNSGAYQASGTFSPLAAGIYIFGVKDNLGATSTISVTLASLAVTSDTGTCSGGSIQLQANSAPAWSYSWSPATGLSSTTIANPIANPASTTTYTASAIIVNSTTNLISNPGFEAGNTGFTSNYIFHTCGQYYSSTNTSAPNPWPCNTNVAQPTPNPYGPYPTNHNGIYKISGFATDLCSNLSGFGPRTGSNMMIIDGTNDATYAASPAWSQTVSGLTTGTYYVFTYWVRNAFTISDGSAPILRTKINGTSLTATGSYANPYTATVIGSWTQQSYLWQATGTSATIEIFDEKQADASNDFALDDLSFYITCNPSKTVTVTITPTPTLNVVSQPTQACIGNGAVISLTGLTVSSTFAVNYKINGVAQTAITGITSDVLGNATFTTIALNAANNGQTLEVTSLRNTAGNSNCTQTFTGKTVALNVNTYVTWLNTGNTDWNTASNWCGGIPTGTTNVRIPDYGLAATYPVIAASTSGLSNNIIIESNASVTINNTGVLTINSSFSNSGSLINNGEVILNGSTSVQSFPGATGTIVAMNNLTVNNTTGSNPAVTFNNNFFISGALTPTAGIINVNNAFVSLLSTASSTARVAPLGGTAGFTYTNNGQFIVQRYYPARRGWRLVTAPFKDSHTIAEAWQELKTSSGLDYSTAGAANTNTSSNTYDSTTAGYATQITGGTTANGFDQGMRNNPSIKYFVQGPPGSWPSPLNTNATNVTSREGWMLFVRGDRKNYGQITDQYKTPVTTTLRPRGQLYTGPKPTSSTGLTVIGNPYASAVDYMSMARTGAGTWPTNPTYYVWDPYLGGTEGVGAFVALTWNSTNSNFDRSAPLTGSGTSTYDNRYIASGAAIMVDFPAAGGTLTINESDKNAYNITTAFRPLPGGKQGQMRTVLSIVNDDKSTAVTDGTLSYFNNEFNNDADVNDARKLGNFNENIVIEKGGKLLSIERRKLLNDGDTVYFGLYRMQQKNYELQFIIDNAIVTPHTVALLEDTYLKTKTPVSMKGETRVPFSITADAASAVTTRFRLVFRRSMAIITSMNATVRTSNAVVEWKMTDEFNIINHFDIERSVDGISFIAAGSQQAGGGLNRSEGYVWTDAKLAPGKYYYRIKGRGNAGEVVYSDVASVEITKRIPLMNVSPNPATGNIIRVQMQNIPRGVYQARLYNGNGKVVLNKKINHNGTSSTEIIQLDKTTAKGVYHLEITGPAGYSAKQKLIIN